MPLQSIIAAVKKNVRHQKQAKPLARYDPAKPIPNLIDATPEAMPVSKQFSSTPTVSNSTSITSIKREFEVKNALKSVSDGQVFWENCKCLKISFEKFFCVKYHGLCVKERCPKHCIEC